LNWHDNFTPYWLVKSGSLQTVASVFWPQPNAQLGMDERSLVGIGDSGYLSIVQTKPKDWQLGQRIVLLVHGLTGSELSTHPVRLAQHFARRGVLAVRMNMRGCGPGAGLAKGIYHSGRSEDTRAVLEWIAQRYPGSPITQIGISLGGNATLKMAGELGRNHPDYLESVVSVSAPIDLHASSLRISAPRNRLFDFYFANHLVKHVQVESRRHPDKVPSLPNGLRAGKISLAKFDDLYVAPISGFNSGRHYYEMCSSLPLLDSIRCRHLLLASEDDPVIPVEMYRMIQKKSNRDLIITRKGGHAAYISQWLDPDYGRFWMDRIIVEWVLGGSYS
jgi:uncharacterized protein